MFRSVVLTPQRLTAAPLVPFSATGGRVVQIRGPGYHGEAQNDATSGSASGLAQSKAQLVVRDIVVHLFVTYQTGALLGVPQLGEAVTLAGDVGKRLASAK